MRAFIYLAQTMKLFDDDQIMKAYINDVREEAREETEKEAKESARKMIQFTWIQKICLNN